MKIFPIYEFLSSTEELKRLLTEIDKKQPVSYEDCLYIINKIIGKRKSRTKITLSNLRKLEFLIKEMNDIKLSWESQMYIDMNRELQNLILYFIYKKKELFDLCKLIYCKNSALDISNSNLVRYLEIRGYKTKKMRSETEKIYAIKRLISCCVTDSDRNPFIEYEEYMSFIKLLQDLYLKMSEKTSLPVEIKGIEENFLNEYKGFGKKYFAKMLVKVYFDPIYSTYTFFSTVTKSFAIKKYFKIADKDYYYFGLIRKIEGIR